MRPLAFAVTLLCLASAPALGNLAGLPGAGTIAGMPFKQASFSAAVQSGPVDAGTPLSSGVIAYWNFDDNLNDVASGIYNGAFNMYSDYTTTAVIGKAVYTGNGGPGEGYVRPTPAVGSSPIATWTVAGWQYKESSVTCTTRVTGNEPRMGVHQVDASNYALKMDTWAKSYSFAWTGGWVHIAASCDSATTTCKAYVNGVLVGTESITNSLYYLDTLGSPVGYCRSLLDEWGVWNRALSDSDIASLYNGGAGKTYPF